MHDLRGLIELPCAVGFVAQNHLCQKFLSFTKIV